MNLIFRPCTDAALTPIIRLEGKGKKQNSTQVLKLKPILRVDRGGVRGDVVHLLGLPRL